MKCLKVCVEYMNGSYWIVLEFGRNDERRFESIAPYKSKASVLKTAKALAKSLGAKLEDGEEK